jgi:hypothetical protein
MRSSFVTDPEGNMPMINEVNVKSDSVKDGEKVGIRDGDKAIVSGDGCTAKEVIIHIMRKGNPKEYYVIAKVVPEFGQWEWDGTITRQFSTLDGKEATLAKDLYGISVDAEGSQTGVCGVINLRDK